MSPSTKVDRAAAVRRALVELVAEHGFRGTSMAAVAEHAGVATGTAYVHYASKDELVIAAYVEVKTLMDTTAVAAVDASARPYERFLQLWRAIHRHLTSDPVSAQFIQQVAASPYAATGQEAVMANRNDPMVAFVEAEDLVSLLVDLPGTVLYDLAIRPAVTLVARGEELDETQLDTLAQSCWRAITREEAD